MEKNLKMWIAVGIVVILVVGVLFYYWVESTTKDGAPAYEYTVKLDISENQTAWIVNVTEVDMYDPYGDEIIENTSTGGVKLKIVRYGINSWNPHITYLNYKPEEYGIEYKDLDKDNGLSIGDQFIIDKSGGTEYQPQEGDRISLDISSESKYLNSNTIILE
ncbi:MAG: hypothetical protein R6U61_03765 [Thermoplasmata archaeon]